MRDVLVRIGKRFIGDVQRDDIAGLSAELAYRFLFAIFPFGIFVAALTAFIAGALGMADPTGQILGALGDNLPSDIAEGVRPQLEAVIGTARPGLLTVGAITALWAATGGTNALIKAMNRAYEVEETRALIPRYALAIGLTLLASVGLLAAFVTIVGASVVTGQVAQQLGLDPGVVDLIGLLRWPVVFVFLSFAVGVLYKLAPNFRLPWRWAFAGGAVMAIGWLLATAGFAFYVANFGSYANTYGALGGVIVLLLWFYLSAIVLIGAAALIATVLKETQPETFAAGQPAVEAKDEDKADANADGDPEYGRRGPSEAPIGAAPRALVPAALAASSARPARRSSRRTRPASEIAASWGLAGSVVALGVAMGTFAARVLERPPRR
jgi:membrane protein